MHKPDPLLFIVSAGILQIPAIFQAKELGLLTAVSDINPHAPAMKYADLPIVLDTWDVEGHITEAKKLAEEFNLVGIYSQGADVEVTVAKTAAALNLPGTNVQAAMNCKNKVLMRKVFSHNNINQVEFAEAKNLDEAYEAVQKIGLPVIFKNVDNSASRGTSVVNKKNQVEKAFIQAQGASKSKTALIEKFMTGSEHSVDMIVYKEKYHPAGICDRIFSPPPFRIEIGHINPSGLPVKIQNEIYKLTEKCGRSLGINFGVAKADILLTKNGPIILEMTNRLSGGFDSQYTKPHAIGSNLIRPTIKMAIGGTPDLNDIQPKYKRVSACLALFPKEGIIKDISGVNDALNMPQVTNVILTKHVGDQAEDVENSGQRVGFVITLADTKSEAMSSAKKAASKIKFSII